MSRYCVTESLSELKSSIEKKQIFSKGLKSSTLLVICEILWNLAKNSNKACKKCFSKKTFKGLKKNKVIVKSLFDKKKTVEKRKKYFINGNKQFKSFITRLLTEFFNNCLEDLN